MKFALGFLIGSVCTGIISEIIFLNYAFSHFFSFSITIGIIGVVIILILETLIDEYKYYREEKEARLVRLITDELKRREKNK